MEILGIGPLELFFILIIALIVLGPKDMVKAGRTMGKFLRQVITSPTWRAVTQASSELRRLPNKLIRDAGIEEEIKEIEKVTKQANLKSWGTDLEKWEREISPWTTPPSGESINPSVVNESKSEENGSQGPSIEQTIDKDAG